MSGDRDPRPLLIGDRWLVGSGGVREAVDPADGRVHALVSQASEQDVDRAVAAAREAADEKAWRDLLSHQRAELLYRIAVAITAEGEALARLQMRENGKTITECRAQARAAAASFRYYAGVSETLETSLHPSRGEYLSLEVYEPVGVVAAIIPWNSPLTIATQKLAPALAAGNAVVLKPSELTPLVLLELGRICREAGLPAGLLNVVCGGPDVGAALVAHPDVGMVSFTGSNGAGEAVAEAAARRLVPSVLELGGKSPNIVFEDADLDHAIAGGVLGIFSSTGQSCVAGSRLLVQRTVYEDVLSRLVQLTNELTIGPPDREDTKVGPLASLAHRDRIEAWIAEARRDGADIVAGGRRPGGEVFEQGAYYCPTVIAGIDSTHELCQRELFGPVLCALPFEDEQEAVALANGTRFGLAAGVWTRDYSRAWRITRSLDAGTVWINTYKQLSIAAPFGGFKHSGLGREKGPRGIRIYQQAKSVYLGLHETPSPWAVG